MKILKQAYTAQFKELAVKRVKEGQGVGVVSKELGLSSQTLRNWVKAAANGTLNSAGTRVVSPEEMELSRLPRVEAWWPSRSQASEQQSDAGTDPGHSCRS